MWAKEAGCEEVKRKNNLENPWGRIEDPDSSFGLFWWDECPADARVFCYRAKHIHLAQGPEKLKEYLGGAKGGATGVTISSRQ